MESQIKKEKTHVKITINEVNDDRDIILKNLQDCQEGNCTCPTNEYEKLAKIDITVKDESNEIFVDLIPKTGKEISINEIEKCLDHTASKLPKKS